MATNYETATFTISGLATRSYPNYDITSTTATNSSYITWAQANTTTYVYPNATWTYTIPQGNTIWIDIPTDSKIITPTPSKKPFIDEGFDPDHNY